MLNANTLQVQTLVNLVAQQGRQIETLTEKVRLLESQGKVPAKKSEPKVEVVDVDCLPTRTLREIMHDVAADTRMWKTRTVSQSGNNLGSEEPVDENNSVTGARNCKRKLEFVTFSTEDMNILYSIKQTHIGSPFAFWSHNRTEILAEETPTCLDLAFRPPPGMRFVGTELAVAAYIFAYSGEPTETLYQDSHCDGTRLRLWSLRPGLELYDDVLNMVVEMCTRSKFDNSNWWLPTTFSISSYFMVKLEYESLIYVPMHIGRHWYLLIIDIWNLRLVYLDSLKPSEVRETQLRIAQIMEVKINDRTRMSLAVDLVTSPQNPLADVIWERAVNHWDAEMLRNHKDAMDANKKSNSTPPSGSKTI
ncbi:hypothetical protein PIB30_067505 [Stylosanthes scabra]|uniref:Ubiquitin-like protease family profile domain-containing protein n=1 Tax=Stylosanthes scabra TaxID=79078 RepID=A0ABU6TNC2_9FABA|nr:hypothetical protein [Stylosanthes scabra]